MAQVKGTTTSGTSGTSGSSSWSGLQWSNPGVMTDLKSGKVAYSPSVSSGSSVPVSPSTISDEYSRLLSQLLTTMQQSNATSAYDAALAAARETNSFNAQQAEIDRQFQQSSAQKAMDFEAQQAEINRAFQQSSAQKAMDFEAQQAQQAMDYQERLANSVYQRGVADLKKAGLSPLLAYQNLQTSAPSGVMASGTSSSGSSASGRSASGSRASGTKADVVSALEVERKNMDRLLSLLTLNVNSALKIAEISFDFLKFW